MFEDYPDVLSAEEAAEASGVFLISNSTTSAAAVFRSAADRAHDNTLRIDFA